MDRFRIRALEKMLASDVLSQEQRAETLAILLGKAAILEQGARKRGKLQRAHYYARLIEHYREHIGNGGRVSASC